MRDEETTLPGHHFWTYDRILLAIIFLIGLAIGGVVTHNYIEPAINSTPDYNSVVELNSRLDQRNDKLYSCLVQNNINPENC